MAAKRDKKRVTLERDKIRQTTHWDMDYLPIRELDAYYQRSKPSTDRPRPTRRHREPLTNRILGFICIGAGVALLILAWVVARYL